MEQTRGLFCTRDLDVRRVLHGQGGVEAVNQMYFFHEAMNGCKNLNIHLRLSLKM